jgi:cobalt-zinc-cadmium efflux system outer membrane protein
MKRILFILLLLLHVGIYCQSSDTLKLHREEIEAIFLKQNLALIAEQMNVGIADAEIVQAKLWDNPTLSVSDVNLWTTGTQRDALRDADANHNTQFAIELSQLITTAGKRRKNIAVQQISKEMAVQEFGETLRGMKTELRLRMIEIAYIQQYETVLSGQVDMLARLINAYEKQVANGNLSKGELLRLQSSSLEMENELYLLKVELNGHLKALNVLLNLPPESYIVVVSRTNDEDTLPPALADLYALATENRPDIKLQKLQTDWLAQTLKLEKAQRVPDITLSANYDRYAGVWKNYVGFGLSFDLPVFNRNQGFIKAATLGLEQSKTLERQMQNTVFNEIAEIYGNYTQSLHFYRKISGNAVLSDLDEMMDVYAKNLLNRNISMLEFIDFMEAYGKSKQIFLEAQKAVNNNFEELQYAVGSDFK